MSIIRWSLGIICTVQFTKEVTVYRLVKTESEVYVSVQTIFYVGELHNQGRLSSDGFLNIVCGTTVHYSLQNRSHIVMIVTMATQMN